MQTNAPREHQHGASERVGHCKANPASTWMGRAHTAPEQGTDAGKRRPRGRGARKPHEHDIISKWNPADRTATLRKASQGEHSLWQG